MRPAMLRVAPPGLRPRHKASPNSRFGQAEKAKQPYRFATCRRRHKRPGGAIPPRSVHKRPASRFLDVSQGLVGSSAENAPTARKSPQTLKPLGTSKKPLD